MNLQLTTKVKGNYKAVMKRFDRDLFDVLIPKYPKMEVVEFTGSKKGDRVHMKFTSPIKTEWIVDITEEQVNEEEAFFIDEGIKLPPGIAKWKHKHIVKKLSENSSLIIDDITFEGSNFLMTLLLYPGLFFGFYPRKKLYQSFFGKVDV